MSFGNPLAVWALLGLLAVLAIHLLQRRPRRIVVSTLFLLDPLSLDSRGGGWIDRLRSSASLWLQLAVAALVAWLLLDPRFVREESVQRVVFLLDASASMSAFRDAAAAATSRRVASLQGASARTEWVLLETGLRQRTLYSGADGRDLLAAVRHFEPDLGTHDFGPALDLARSLAGPGGLSVLVTDHDHEVPVPEGVEQLAVGRPIDNVGFAGADTDAGSWRATIRNYGRTDATRSWWIEAGHTKTNPTAATLKPGESKQVSGPFPTGQPALEVVLDGDEFPLDDRLPLVRPSPKPLEAAVAVGEAERPFVERFLPTLDGVTTVADARRADLVVRSAPPGPVPELDRPGIVLLDASRAGRAYGGGPIVAEPHLLTAGVSWQGLLAREGPGFVPAAADHVLVWQGERPLVFLRKRTLVVSFPLEGGNADRLGAFLLLLHRHAEGVRAAKVGHEAVNVETGQALEVALDPAAPPARVVAEGRGSEPRALRAPARPGFFRVVQGSEPRLTAAAHFADAREADLKQAASHERPASAERRLKLRNSRPDPFTTVWLLLIGAALVADWSAGARARR